VVPTHVLAAGRVREGRRSVRATVHEEAGAVPSKSANVKNEKQYEALKDKGMSKQRAARIANSEGSSSRGGKKSGSGGDSSQGGTTAQKKKAGRKGGKASSNKS
jgi:hypothetical protein